MLEPASGHLHDERVRSSPPSMSPCGSKNVQSAPKRTRAGQLKEETSSSGIVSGDSDWYATSSSDSDENVSSIKNRHKRYPRSTWGRRHVTGTPKRTKAAWVYRSPHRTPRHRLRSSSKYPAPPPLLPHVHPFRRQNSAATHEKRPVHPVFLRSPRSRRLRRFERSPNMNQKFTVSPLHDKSTPKHMQAPAPFSNKEEFAWFDSSDSELSSVPDESSSFPELDDTPTHIPAQHIPQSNQNLPEQLSHEPTSYPGLKPAKIKTPTPKASESAYNEVQALDLGRLDLLDYVISPEKLVRQERIGAGAFKDVYRGLYHVSRTRVLPVAICDLRDELTEMDIKELKFLRDLRHENIVQFIGIGIPTNLRLGPPCVIVSELCENGDLFDFIRNTPPPPDVNIFRILLQIARGLEYLHTHKPMIVHRDCKSTNVLINAQGIAKISDFGLARVKRSKYAMIRSLVGTVNWQAVELWSPKPQYNEKVDVWSAAMTFWEALQWHQTEKRYPFQGLNEHQIYMNVRQKHLRYAGIHSNMSFRPFTGSIRRRYGDDIVHLIDQMWQQNPRDRPSMSEVCTEIEALIASRENSASPS